MSRKEDVERYLGHNCLTVDRLIEELTLLKGLGISGETPVCFQYNYGDHGRTQVAERASEATEGIVRWSEYHRMGAVVDEDHQERYEGESLSAVLIS